MKLDQMLRKAAPFLLIAIFIACLFSMPQKEGMSMKGAKQYSHPYFPIAHSLKAPAKKLPQEYSSWWEKKRGKPASDLITV